MDAEPREVMGRSGRRLVHPMTGCGLAVVGPPFGFDDDARVVLAYLAPKLAQGPSPTWSVEVIAS
jgi:23S rRNA (adenine2030-N6)-methyltransferase